MPEVSVIHYTGGGRASGTVSWFANPVSRVSAHFVLARDGHTVQTVDLDYAAWHAGMSEMTLRGETFSGANQFSIGYELANRGLLYLDSDGKFWSVTGKHMQPYYGPDPVEACMVFDGGYEVTGWWEPYSEPQLEALSRLLKFVADNGYKKSVERIVGHESIAMPFGRKSDPGPLFPWERFGGEDRQRTKSYDP